MRCSVFLSSLLLALVLILPVRVCRAAAPAPLWLNLWQQEMTAWGENANRIDQLCPATLPTEQRTACRTKNLQPHTWSFDVFAQPSVTSRRIGAIRITVVPGRAVLFDYHDADSDSAVPFRPDLDDPDWGYGPYLCQTVLEVHDNWCRLPADPFPGPVWIDSRRFDSGSILEPGPLLRIQTNAVYTLGEESLVVLEVTDTGLMVRPEGEDETGCSGERRVAPELLRQRRLVPFSALYDQRGHLLLKLKYTRGC